MRRREFVTLLAGAALARPHLVMAQQAGKRPVAALIFAATPLPQMAGPDPASLVARAFVYAMRDLDWVGGRTIVIERRSAEGQPERAQPIFAELVERGVDVMAVGGAPWLVQAAQRATRTIPIVALFAEDPVAEGLVASLAHPGGNLTGLTPTVGCSIVATGRRNGRSPLAAIRAALTTRSELATP